MNMGIVEDSSSIADKPRLAKKLDLYSMLGQIPEEDIADSSNKANELALNNLKINTWNEKRQPKQLINLQPL